MRRKNGFIALPVDGEVVEYAVEIRRERDSKLGNIYSEKPTDMRHVGEIGELAFDHFTKHLRYDLTEWIVDGKVTHQPDFIFAGKRIGVKTVKRQNRTKLANDYFAQITESHRNEPVDYFFFCSYELDLKELVLLGGIDKEEFLRIGRVCPPGTKVTPFYTVRDDHTIILCKLTELQSPEAFFGELIRDYEASMSTNAA